VSCIEIANTNKRKLKLAATRIQIATQSLKTKFLAKMERKIKNLELKKSGNYCFYLCEFLSSKFNLLCFFFSLCG